MIVHDRSRACLTWPTRYVTVRHHVEIAPGALAERGTYDLPALQVLACMAEERPILVPRSSGALAVVAANDTERAS